MNTNRLIPAKKARCLFCLNVGLSKCQFFYKFGNPHLKMAQSTNVFFCKFPLLFLYHFRQAYNDILCLFLRTSVFSKKRSSTMIMVVFPPSRKKSQDSRYTCSFTRLSFFMSMSSSSPCTLTMKCICNQAISNIEAAHLTIDRITPLVFI